MTTDKDASAVNEVRGQSSPGRAAAFLHRYLPVWRTVYALLEQVASLRQQLAETQSSVARVNHRIDDVCLRIDEVCLRIDEVCLRIDEVCLRVDQGHQRVLEGEERLGALQDSVQVDRRLAGQSAADQLKLDQWYQDLQSLHRGAPEAVLEVQRSYLDHFRDRAWLRAAGPVADLGCGRGEWLSLMAQEGWMMRGVDSSARAVDEARERGLDVELGDLVEFLEACPESSLSGVTAFQVIEHLPFGRITALMHAAFRALVPGGILLLETPNPENLQVASYSFWLDPTHRHPIPPPLIMDLSYHVGFRDGSVLRKNAWPQWREQETETSLESEVAYRLFGPQDYALLVYKPASDAQ